VLATKTRDPPGDIVGTCNTILRGTCRSTKTSPATPVRATDHEAARMREIANEGKSLATPATLMGVAFIVPVATVLSCCWRSA